MKLENFLKELRKSEKLSPKGDVFIVQQDKAVLRVKKVKTSGDMVLVYVENQNSSEG